MEKLFLSSTDQEALYEKARQYLQLEQDPFFHREISELLENKDQQQIFERFYSDLDFGTGGVRAIIGGGSNRINPYNISKISQGLANYLKQYKLHSSVVIAHDSRHYSDSFSLQAALVFAANGIRCYLFDGLRPTPELSYTVRYFKATAGIMITASHNPLNYNGYKVYWGDGAQVVAPHDEKIIAEVSSVSGAVRSLSESQARSQKLIITPDSDVDESYTQQIVSQSLRKELFEQESSGLNVVYTPLHGAGHPTLTTVARRLGIELFVVPEQAEPDGNFPTVKSPNPEDASAMEIGLKYAFERKADLLLGSDPDADRLGIAAPDGNDYRLVTGNQLGALLLDYICSSYKEKGIMPERPAFINTIVTSPLQAKIAKHYHVKCFQTLTGFKHIAALIAKFEKEASFQFLFGCEESYGYLIGDQVRDKDAVAAAAIAIEMALWNRKNGRSIFAHLQELYKSYGLHREHTINIAFPGASGSQEMLSLMEKLRQQPPQKFAGNKVVMQCDYLRSKRLSSQGEQTIDFPRSNVLHFVTEDQSVVILRPSGTEPKIKVYICISCDYELGAEQKLEAKLQDFIASCNKLVEH